MPLERPTGDVEPPTCGGWGYVAKWGRWGYFPKCEDLNVVARLAGYEYMRPFYEEIFRCKVDGVYAYSASIEGGDANSRRIAAVIKLLDEILRIMSAWITTTTVAEVKQKYREARNMYDTLMRDADAVEFNRADMETLHSAAMIYRTRGLARYECEMRFATLNKSRHCRDRALVIQIGDMVRKLFPKSGYQTIARLATAATGRKIAKATVQKWSPRIQKRTKKAKS